MIVNPAEDLPEQKSLTLLVLPPSLPWDENGGVKEAVRERVKSISSRCGGKDRIYRNTLLFLAGSIRGLAKLRQAHRERAALEGVRADYWEQLDEEQREDLKKRLDAARRTALESLGPAYTVALLVRAGSAGGQAPEVEVCTLSDARRSFQEHLGYSWTILVEDEEWILRRVGSVTLDNTGLIPKKDALRLKDAVEAYLRFTDKPMVSAKEAVTAGLAQACMDGLVGIGRGPSPSALQSRYCKQAVALDPSEDGLWIIPPFSPESIGGAAASGSAAIGVGAGDLSSTFHETGSSAKDKTPETGTVSPKEAEAEDKVRGFAVRGAVPVENWGELFRCFVGPAARMNLKKLRLGVQFEMQLPEGTAMSKNDPALKAMKEAAQQLGLTLEIEK